MRAVLLLGVMVVAGIYLAFLLLFGAVAWVMFAAARLLGGRP